MLFSGFLSLLSTWPPTPAWVLCVFWAAGGMASCGDTLGTEGHSRGTRGACEETPGGACVELRSECG